MKMERELLAATLAKTFSFTNIFPQVILLEMIFSLQVKILRGTAKTFSTLNTLNTTWHLPHAASETPNEILQYFTQNHVQQWLKQDQQVTVRCTGNVRTLLTHHSLSGVSWRTARFHTRTCPSSFHLLATDGMRTCTASLGSWLCPFCSCNGSISQMGRPGALGHFRRTSWRCARPDT